MRRKRMRSRMMRMMEVSLSEDLEVLEHENDLRMNMRGKRMSSRMRRMRRMMRYEYIY